MPSSYFSSALEACLGFDLEFEFDDAFELDNGLDVALFGVRDHAIALAYVCENALDCGVALNIAHVHEISDSVIQLLTLGRSLAHDIAQGGARARELVMELALGLGRLRDFVHEFACIRAHDRSDEGLGRDEAQVRAHEHSLSLMTALELAHKITLRSMFSSVVSNVDGSAHVRVSPLAGRLAGIAVRMLPRADRLRYTEECLAELYELAHGSRRAQWMYSLRLLASVGPLRRELQRDAREVMQDR